MLLIGLGLGQLMQTLTIASQNSVGLRDMGVATSASTFFRQIGGTLGTAVLLSLLFTVFPTNIDDVADRQGDADRAPWTPRSTPRSRTLPRTSRSWSQIYNKIVDPIEAQPARRAPTCQQLTPGVPQAVVEPGPAPRSSRTPTAQRSSTGRPVASSAGGGSARTTRRS